MLTERRGTRVAILPVGPAFFAPNVAQSSTGVRTVPIASKQPRTETFASYTGVAGGLAESACTSSRKRIGRFLITSIQVNQMGLPYRHRTRLFKSPSASSSTAQPDKLPPRGTDLC